MNGTPTIDRNGRGHLPVTTAAAAAATTSSNPSICYPPRRQFVSGSKYRGMAGYILGDRFGTPTANSSFWTRIRSFGVRVYFCGKNK